MDLHARKINFIQEFLRLKNEKIINKLENILKSEKKRKYEKELVPMTEDEFNKIIDQAENDSNAGRLTNARELKKEIDSWT